ncbi:hypothetical protein LTR78_001068 [Recurvomyces mirabilis]|uniref:Uncharacterized protein n=1 Tax=Recurvomyces mirabilis TaxID=574656 RepID=A0AAE1C633_9PEZI|nr:hypothetical protein LTR78_001068 [Recurvomyces mirabilis]KAK5159040.1 hypothetical protein LTS14_003148 [Recurvomyces mirabilis]
MYGIGGSYGWSNSRTKDYGNHGSRGPAYGGYYQQPQFKRAYHQAGLNPYGNNLPQHHYQQPRVNGEGLGLNINGMHQYSRTYGESYSSGRPSRNPGSLDRDLFRRDYANRPRAVELRDRYGPGSKFSGWLRHPGFS